MTVSPHYPVVIRAADSDDALAIATIHVRSWQHAYAEILPAEGLKALSIEQRQHQWSGWLQSPANPMRVLVAERDDNVIGFASWGPNSDADAAPDSVMLYSIYMLPKNMGEGIGSRLLRVAERDMATSGAEVCTLHVLVENTPTRTFYEHRGWNVEPGSEQQEKFFGMEMTTIRFRKLLT